MKSVIRICYITLILSKIYSQVTIGQWSSLTSPLVMRDIALVNQKLYVATEGGLFILDDNRQYQTLTNIEGLEGVNLSSIALDQDSNLWIGGSTPNGFLQIYNPVDQKSVNVFNFGISEILDIQVIKKYSWVLFKSGQDIGLMKFIYDNGWEYRDIFKNFPLNVGSINCFTANDSVVYIGTDVGLYFSKISNNMKDPNNWLPLIIDFTFEITSIGIDSSSLIFSSMHSLYEYNLLLEDHTIIDISYALDEISNLFIVSDGVMIVDGDNLYHKKNDESFLIQNKFFVNTLIEKDNVIISGTNHGLLVIDDNYNLSKIIPNAPVTNNFSAIELLNDGRLVGGSSKGISIYSE